MSPADPGEGAPHNCVWVRQLSVSHEWVFAFLTSEGELFQRVYESMAYVGYGKKVDIDLDASPWRGLGGILRISDRFVAYFSDPLSSEDVARFEHPIGASSGQQT